MYSHYVFRLRWYSRDNIWNRLSLFCFSYIMFCLNPSSFARQILNHMNEDRLCATGNRYYMLNAWLLHRFIHKHIECCHSFQHNIVSHKTNLNPETSGNAWVHSQYGGCWCPGAKAPGHQYPQCWLNIHCIGPVSYKHITLMLDNIRKKSYILKKWPSRLRVKAHCHCYHCF